MNSATPAGTESLGFGVRRPPIGQGTPFANVLLIAHAAEAV